MRIFRVKCPTCGTLAVIKKTEWKHQELADLYCACQNVMCSHSFVFNATFSHTLSPSGLTGETLVKELIERLNPNEKQLALSLLSQ